MTTWQQNPSDLSGLREGLMGRLHQFARLVRWHLMLEAAARWLAIVAGLALLTFVLDRTLRLSHLTRQVMLTFFIVIVAIETWRRLLAPLRMSLRPDVLAAALERKTGVPVAARVASVLELPLLSHSVKGQPGAVVSGAMVERAVRLSHESLADVDFAAHLDGRRRNVAGGAIGLILVIALALVTVFPASARLWAARLFAGSDQPWPQKTYLQVAGLRDRVMLVARGEPFTLRVAAREGAVVPDSISIHWRQGRSGRVNAALTKFDQNDFRYEFPPIQSEVDVQVTGGDDVFGPFTIRPVDRPKIVDLKLLTQHPTEAAAREHSFTADDAGDLSFLPLTRMELRFAANTAIAEARIKSSITQPSSQDLRQTSEREFALRWTQSAATQLQIELTGAEANLNSAPTNVSIGLKTDKPPRATLGYSGVRQRVTPQATIPLVAEARDDFGIQRIELNVKTEITDPDDPKQVKRNATTQPIFPATQSASATQTSFAETEVRQPHPIALPAMQLRPGHLLSVSATATDACYTGAQTASSRAITFRVVRSEELFREILLRQQAERAKFRKQIEEARKLRESLANAASDEALKQIGRQHRTNQREINRVHTALSDSLTEMRLNVLATPEAYAMMENNILQPLKQLDSELMVPQRDALDELRANSLPEDRASALERQDQIIARMELILKQMSQWDSFVDVLNQLNEIIRVQNQVQQGTHKLKRSQTEGAFDR